MNTINTSRKAIALERSPHAYVASIELGVDCGWCNVRHHFTDMYTIGTLSAPRMPTVALHCARRSESSTNDRSDRYPTKIRRSTAVDVSRASHVHQMPQVGRAQIEPSASVS